MRGPAAGGFIAGMAFMTATWEAVDMLHGRGTLGGWYAALMLVFSVLLMLGAKSEEVTP